MNRRVKFGVQTRIDLWNSEMLELLGRAGCVSIEAGVESISEQGRELLDKKSKLTTAQFTERLIEAKRNVPFVQANLLDAKVDDAAEIERLARAPAAVRRLGQPAGAVVSLPRLAGLPEAVGNAGRRRRGSARIEYYLRENSEFSDIQNAQPLPLQELELQR